MELRKSSYNCSVNRSSVFCKNYIFSNIIVLLCATITCNQKKRSFISSSKEIKTMGRIRKKKQTPKCSKKGRRSIKRLSEPNLNKTTQCSICLDTSRRRKLKTLQCSHVFHEKCINEWLHTNENCPVCREPSQKPKSANTSRGSVDSNSNPSTSNDEAATALLLLLRIIAMTDVRNEAGLET
ncbi:hypothetical protein TNCT_101151 [Trichonephila clavata]|uniref:RING-type domain-containing protein n=1 Tax=Trichonephila clavata TaxID=2740835 RepID=A0A8X6IJK3_TRICU|nr:hypothetical protein TNCT_101151 [Trichonephila clavata]